MNIFNKTAMVLSIFVGVNAFAGREAGGGDPRADEFINNLEVVCSYMPTVSALKSYAENCRKEFDDMKKSLNSYSRKARVSSTLGPVKDKNGVDKPLVTEYNETTRESTVLISTQAWSSLENDQKLVAAYMEAKLLLGIPVERYGGDELKDFKSSSIFIDYVSRLNRRNEQIYQTAASDLEVCPFVYLEKQGRDISKCCGSEIKKQQPRDVGFGVS